MVGYEFYCCDAINGDYQLIGVLPERRKNPGRITHDSIINWGRKLLGDKVDGNDIFFVQIKMEQISKIHWLTSSFRASRAWK
jgi:hypothetical protein